MTNIEIRRKIMEMVYERFKEHPYHRITPKEFKERLKIAPKELSYNIIYLEEKGYLELQKPLEGNIFVGARITPNGVDLVEDEYRFDIVFPITHEKASLGEDVFEAFDRFVDKINSAEKMVPELKEIIIEEIKTIKQELEKNDPSYARVKSFLYKIKEKDAGIYKNILEILKNPIIIKLLSESAKKELDL